ncbi:MAG: RNase adapter RapZ [Oscillospiraceae bacterium]|nr:RNase adapter RapZ [Oscillospiraceae bacterium]MBQ2792142.1 RNase adapter RapZ [Oscillospiraceae bacterium]MBQ3242335.1 RNase adapter RapZ [Oscillospiraceae bacterium]MBQ7083294.1 RNase adapter RapZ [Oscillospiraceae bacterium]MBR6607831.1 RNase adapter RapZ [Oscillospiraceae bacterium]
MRFVIVTGMSGAGKSQAINALEDLGYYCVDNMPPKLLLPFFRLGETEQLGDKIAIVVDSRGGEMFSDLFGGLEELKKMGYTWRILYLDARDDVIVTRYKETRRRHPLMDEEAPSMKEALEKERKLLRPALDQADYIIDTSLLSSTQLKSQVEQLFLQERREKMLINCTAFGFKYGVPTDADLVFDVRCLPNPFYIPELKELTGLDEKVRDYVFSHEESEQLFQKIRELLELTIPLYEKEGKRQLVVAFGCTGGKHRSVSFAWRMAELLRQEQENVYFTGRDFRKVKA